MSACCSQGIEYVLTEDFTCPEGYPEDGEIVTVTSVFDVYLENNTMYCTLRDGKMSWKTEHSKHSLAHEIAFEETGGT